MASHKPTIVVNSYNEKTFLDRSLNTIIDFICKDKASYETLPEEFPKTALTRFKACQLVTQSLGTGGERLYSRLAHLWPMPIPPKDGHELEIIIPAVFSSDVDIYIYNAPQNFYRSVYLCGILEWFSEEYFGSRRGLIRDVSYEVDSDYIDLSEIKHVDELEEKMIKRKRQIFSSRSTIWYGLETLIQNRQERFDRIKEY